MISLSTLLGVIAGMVLFSWAVLSATQNWAIFISYQSAAIVLGGTITSSFIGYRWRYIFHSLLAIPRIFVHQKIGPKSLMREVGKIVEWSRLVQKDGPQAFEAIGAQTKDDFIKYIISLISTGYSTNEVRDFTETTIEEHYFRNLSQANILVTMASASPAFGMVGTLIGLIVMLSKMENPAEMGQGLSMALMTTLYGVLIARFIFQPTSTKVRQILGINRFREYLVLEGFILILEKKSPFYIQDRLNSYLDRKSQYSLESKDKAG